SVKNLYVLGETACTGLHGANRLASNSLLEATLMATGLAATLEVDHNKTGVLPKPPVVHAPTEDTKTLTNNYVERIKEIMQTYCNIVKTNSGLDIAIQELWKIRNTSQQNLPSESISYKAF